MLDKRLMNEIENKKIYYASLGGRALALSLLAVAQSVLLALCINKVFLEKARLSTLTPWLLALSAVFIIRPILMGFHDYSAKQTASDIKRRLRAKLVVFLNAEGGQNISATKTGELSTLAVEGIESVDAYFSEFVPQLFLVAVNTVVILAFALSQDVISALIMMFTAPLIPLFMILIGKTADGINRKQWDHLKTMNGHLLDVLRGMVTLRHFRKHLTQTQSVERMSEGFRKATLKVLRISFLSAFTLELLATLSTAVVAVSLGLRLLYGWMHFLPALTVLLLAPEFFQPLRLMGQKFHAAMNGKIAADQLYPLLESTSFKQVDDTAVHATIAEALLVSTSVVDHLTTTQPLIVACDLTFGYTNSSEVFQQLSFSVNSGESMALTGRSGIGKTTLVRLLTGSLKTYQGSLMLAGRELREWDTNELSKWLSYVPQTPRVFRGTLMDNLRFGRPEASVEETLLLSRLTGFHTVAEKLPLGYDTPVGQGAAQLSGGETQLMAITRACLRNTPIVIMDEPTSAMDLHMENLLTQAMALLMKDRTLLVAAHRKHTVSLCNRNLRLDRFQESELGGDTP